MTSTLNWLPQQHLSCFPMKKYSGIHTSVNVTVLNYTRWARDRKPLLWTFWPCYKKTTPSGWVLWHKVAGNPLESSKGLKINLLGRLVYIPRICASHWRAPRLMGWNGGHIYRDPDKVKAGTRNVYLETWPNTCYQVSALEKHLEKQIAII